MLRLIECTTCNTTGSFPIQIELTFGRKSCADCGHITERKETYFFCSPNCFREWYEKSRVLGIECPDCHGTGFSAGFKSNGACKTCQSSGRLFLLS